jgi:hypothetical protein
MSALADRSYAVRYAQKRAAIMARAANAARYQNQTTGAPIPPQVGPGGVGAADSDRQTIALGRRRIWREYNPAPCTGSLPGGKLTYPVNPPNPEGDGCCPPPESA